MLLKMCTRWTGLSVPLCQPKSKHRLKIPNAAWNSPSAGYSDVYFGSLNGELGCKGNAVLGDGPGCWCLEHRREWGSSSWLGCSVCSPAGCSCKHSPVVSIFHFSFRQRTGAYALTQPSSTSKKFFPLSFGDWKMKSHKTPPLTIFQIITWTSSPIFLFQTPFSP